MDQSVLVVDDKMNVQKLLFDFLTLKGYQVTCASNGRDAFFELKKQSFDIILLDIMMPQIDGYQFIEQLRKTSDTPIIMISAKQQEEDLIKGFNLGADDYITKPFKINELLARMKAVLKRTSMRYSNNELIKVANLSLDITNKELRINNKIADITLAELSLLELLMKSVECSVNKATLCMHLIDAGYSGSESTLKIHIRNLRHKLETQDTCPVQIESVFAVGYRLRNNKL